MSYYVLRTATGYITRTGFEPVTVTTAAGLAYTFDTVEQAEQFADANGVTQFDVVRCG